MDHSPDSKKGMYLHNKSGKLYEVLGTALHTETNEQMVVYRPLYETKYELFVRPYDMFFETVVLHGRQVPRFEKIEDA
ncbi:MAG TPA: DUF1653 domain-containing protein [Candidatus Saccharibacteria bacterium]|jgi:hypothetical protein|nr:DUF1653 domain-containing protein [Candidatus Saccharibacteria bacterium]HMR38682.1 DUF1653 domain-containing protein [Candidatus Saccharibacteria bacterium]